MMRVSQHRFHSHSEELGYCMLGMCCRDDINETHDKDVLLLY